MKALISILLAASVLASQGAWAKNKKAPFSNNALNINIENVDGMVVGNFYGSTDKDILLLGRDNERNKQVQLLTLEKGLAAKEQLGTLMLPDSVLFYDIADMAGQDAQSVVFLEAGKVSAYDFKTKNTKVLVESPSLYRDTVRRTSKVSRIGFVRDVNNDGLSDIVLADFTQTRVFVQQTDGSFAPSQSIQMQAQMRTFRDNSAVYSGSPLYVADHNFDGEHDLIFRTKSELHVFLQQSGKFSSTAKVMSLDLQQPLTDEFDNIESDHSNMLTHRFFQLIDLNNDGMLDLITQLTRSSGLLDKTSQYQVYFGAKGEQGLVAYQGKPDSVLASEGLQFELKMLDFDGDNNIDLVSPSYELGVGSIIASLFSSSADLDISFHKLNGSGVYNAKPNLEKELTVDFNLSSGQNVYPLLKIHDYNGDGINDLLIGYGSKKVYLYIGEQSSRLFARRAQKYSVKLPRDGRLITSDDLNRDGKTDLIIRYSKLDGDNLHQQMKILLAD